MTDQKVKVTLRRKKDQVLAKTGGSDEEKPAKIVWARPVSGRGEEVCILDPDNREIAFLEDLSQLDPESMAIAKDELHHRYLISRIAKVNEAEANYGNRYWDVETDRGPRRFVMRDPAANAVWLTADRLVLRDTLGNRYEIVSMAALDEASRAFVNNVL